MLITGAASLDFLNTFENSSEVCTQKIDLALPLVALVRPSLCGCVFFSSLAGRRSPKGEAQLVAPGMKGSSFPSPSSQTDSEFGGKLLRQIPNCLRACCL